MRKKTEAAKKATKEKKTNERRFRGRHHIPIVVWGFSRVVHHHSCSLTLQSKVWKLHWVKLFVVSEQHVGTSIFSHVYITRSTKTVVHRTSVFVSQLNIAYNKIVKIHCIELGIAYVLCNAVYTTTTRPLTCKQESSFVYRCTTVEVNSAFQHRVRICRHAFVKV